MVDGVRRSVYAATEREARKKLAELKQQVAQAGVLTAPGKLTVDDLLRQWLETVRPTLKPRTIYDYEALARRYISPAIGKLRLSRLSPSQVQKLYADLQARGLDRAPAQVHAVLHRACQLAVLWRLLPENPCDRVVKPGYAAPRREVWNRQQVQAFLAGTQEHWLQPLWTLAAVSGCRLGELLALSWDAVDLEAGHISIRRNLARIDREWVYSTPKTQAGTRVIALPPQGVGALRKQRAQQAAWRLKAGPEWQDSGLVFTRTNGQPVYAPVVCHALESVCKQLGLPKLTPHGLRHLHASLLLAEGVPITDVSQRLGHSNVAITGAVYAHALPGQGQRAAECIGRALGGAAMG